SAPPCQLLDSLCEPPVLQLLMPPALGYVFVRTRSAERAIAIGEVVVGRDVTDIDEIAVRASVDVVFAHAKIEAARLVAERTCRIRVRAVTIDVVHSVLMLASNHGFPER